jgi:hypothetical protein
LQSICLFGILSAKLEMFAASKNRNIKIYAALAVTLLVVLYITKYGDGEKNKKIERPEEANGPDEEDGAVTSIRSFVARNKWPTLDDVLVGDGSINIDVLFT